MTQFPLLQNELTRIARKRSTYAIRVAIILLIIFIVAVVLYFRVAIAFLQDYGYPEPLILSQTMISGAEKLVIPLALLLAFLRATGAIAREKRDRTLPLLLLASTTPADIVLAKFATILIESFTLVLCILPLYAFGAYAGGITFPDILNNFAWLITAILIISAAGLFASAAVATLLGARLAAATFIAFFMAISFLWNTGPGTRFFSGVYLGIHEIPGATALEFALTAGTAFILLSLYGAAYYIAQEAAHLGVAPQKTRIKRRSKKRSTTALLRAGIFGFSLSNQPLIARLAAFALLTAVATIEIIGAWLVLIIAYLDIVAALQRYKTTGGLDDLRTAPIPDRELGVQAFATIFRSALPYLLAVIAGQLIHHYTYAWPLTVLEGTTLALSLLALSISAYAITVAFATNLGVSYGIQRYVGAGVSVFLFIIVDALAETIASYLDPGGLRLSELENSMPVLATSHTAVALLTLILTLIVILEIGKQWRADLSPKKPWYDVSRYTLTKENST